MNSPLPNAPHPSFARRIIRKRIDEDCLLANELHPSVAERLERVRELPVTSVANLLGVERDEQGVWLIWQYVPGTSLEARLSQEWPPGERERLMRELRLAVAAMHSHGIIHGAIHPRNVIVDAAGRVVLTHVSPLLWSEPAADEVALQEIAERIGMRLDQKSIDSSIDAEEDRAMRRRAYLLALAVAVFGVVLFITILWYIRA